MNNSNNNGSNSSSSSKIIGVSDVFPHIYTHSPIQYYEELNILLCCYCLPRSRSRVSRVFRMFYSSLRFSSPELNYVFRLAFQTNWVSFTCVFMIIIYFFSAVLYIFFSINLFKYYHSKHISTFMCECVLCANVENYIQLSNATCRQLWKLCEQVPDSVKTILICNFMRTKHNHSLSKSETRQH